MKPTKTMPITNWMYFLGLRLGTLLKKINYPFAYRFSEGMFDAVHIYDFRTSISK